MTASSAPKARTSLRRVYILRHTTASISVDKPTHTPIMVGYWLAALASGDALMTHPDDDMLASSSAGEVLEVFERIS